MHEVTTDDLILLRSIDAKLSELKSDVEDLQKRVRRVERVHPGGRWAKTVERLVLALIAGLVTWQTTRPPSGLSASMSVSPPCAIAPSPTTGDSR